MVPLQSNIYLALSMSWGSQHWLQFWPARGFLFLHWQIFIVLWQGSNRKKMVMHVTETYLLVPKVNDIDEVQVWLNGGRNGLSKNNGIFPVGS